MQKTSDGYQPSKTSKKMINHNQSIRQSVVLDSDSQRLFRMRKGILTASRLVNERLTSDKCCRWVPLMVTLTYRPDVDWAPEHVSQFLNRVQMYAKRQGQKLPYVWVMELQKSGKPHYHCIIWIPRRWRLPRADSRGWWPHGSTNTVRATNPYGYLSKYASKAQGLSGHQFPKGARIHGIGGLTFREASIVAWWKLPKALRLGDEGSHRWRRRSGGGWICIEGDASGKHYESDWGLSSINATDRRVRLVEKPSVIYRRVRDSLISAWSDSVSEANFDLSRRWCLLSEINRVSWNALGVAVVSRVQTSAPIRAESIQAIPLVKYHSEPLPF